MNNISEALGASMGDNLADLARDVSLLRAQERRERNKRVQKRYDDLMAEGKHGHYETMFRVVREEIELERDTQAKAISALFSDGQQ